MNNLLDYLVRIGESLRDSQVERLSRMYPGLREDVDERAKLSRVKSSTDKKELKTLKTNHSRTV